jgi:hypothetical protein
VSVIGISKKACRAFTWETPSASAFSPPAGRVRIPPSLKRFVREKDGLRLNREKLLGISCGHQVINRDELEKMADVYAHGLIKQTWAGLVSKTVLPLAVVVFPSALSAIDSEGRTIFVADAHRGDGKRFVVRADEKLTAFVELEAAVRAASAF